MDRMELFCLVWFYFFVFFFLKLKDCYVSLSQAHLIHADSLHGRIVYWEKCKGSY